MAQNGGKNRVVVYCRVSTGEQTTDNQLPQIINSAASRGWEVVKVYQEEVSAWKAGHQVELSKLLIAARQHQFDILMIWALDRLSREGPLRILSMLHELGLFGVRVVSCQEPWLDLPGPAQELLLCLSAWMAEQESQRRSERTKAGIHKPGVIERVGKRGPDKVKRKRTGYLLRYANKRPATHMPNSA